MSVKSEDYRQVFNDTKKYAFAYNDRIGDLFMDMSGAIMAQHVPFRGVDRIDPMDSPATNFKAIIIQNVAI